LEWWCIHQQGLQENLVQQQQQQWMLPLAAV
jgi:hypothetical protein